MMRTRGLLGTLGVLLALQGAGAGAAAAETYKIGLLNALTGAYAFGGVPIEKGMRLAIDQANRAGTLGADRLEAVSVDTASDKAQTITQTTRLARADNVLMILGPDTTLEALGAAPAANDQKLPIFAIGSARAITATGPYAFKVQEVGDDIMVDLARYAVGKLGIRKVALVFERTNEGFVTQKEAFRQALLAAGASVVMEDSVLASDSNFAPLGTKLAAADIDAFFVATPAEQGANILVQAREAGLARKVRFLAPSTFATPAFIKFAGSAGEEAVLVADYFGGNPNKLNQDFIAAYSAAYGGPPDNWAAMGYALTTLAIEAIRAAGPGADREKVKDALDKLRNQPTVLGSNVWTMDAARNPYYGAVVLTVQAGKFVLAP